MQIVGLIVLIAVFVGFVLSHKDDIQDIDYAEQKNI